MKSTATSKRVIGLAVTGALAGVLLSGCVNNAAPAATLSATKAEQALASGKHDKAITHAEAAVLAEPHNAAYRSMLASAYLDAGRFASAETTFNDAILLGDNSARNALSLALAQAAQGKYRDAQSLLNQWEGDIATADLGLALALAGQPERGIHLMGNAIRAGENTAKMRQNLAYSYALAGRWREARLIAAQDVPADQINDRIEQWAIMANPQSWQVRVAALLDVPVGVSDTGQPTQLALGNNPSIQQLAAEAAGTTLAASPTSELPALAPLAAPVEVARAESSQAERSNFDSAFAPTPASDSLSTVARDGSRAVPTPAAPVYQASSHTASQAPAARAARGADGTHLVQLGSFSSEAGAKRAWGIYVKKYPELSGHQMVVSEAVVRGKRYWRVSAAGFGKSTASSMCSRVKSAGAGCFAYAEGRPLPGAVDTGVRLARR